MAFYLAFKEVWRNKGRFLLFSLVIALITLLVLFIAALATGLSTSNKQYLSNLDAELLVFQDNSDLQITSSRLSQSKVNQVRRVEGVADQGLIGTSAATVVFADGREPVDISLLGVEPGKPGEPAPIAGRSLRSKRADEVVIDRLLADQANVEIGDTLIIKSVQGTEEEYYDLRVVGITEEQRYFFQPSVFVPLYTWDEIKPQAAAAGDAPLTGNIIAVKLSDPAAIELMQQRLSVLVDDIEVADIPSVIEVLPGYSAQQSTLNTQQGFTFLIGVLVLGGFFQIQTLQKVGQIGMLKAVGAPNRTVATATLMQIVIVTIVGVGLGVLAVLGFALGLPEGIPIIFTGQSIIIAIVALLVIGPLGGLVSIRVALRVEPLTALGL
ncbi:MAG: ABC transporter permease [Anaerolineales bacterium]|nr:ABC transporter permease [Anaerolineales bacterium]